MSTPETWDEIYEKFSEFSSLDESFYQRLIRILLDSIEDSKSILEVGSGSGFLASVLQKRNFSQFGDYLVKFLTDNQLSEKLSNNFYNHIISTFSWDALSETFESQLMGINKK